MLRRLLSDPALEGVTHVVVDEVHERSADSDLLLLLLRDLLRAGLNSKLRIVLMSATAEADAFMQYFDAALDKVLLPHQHHRPQLIHQTSERVKFSSLVYAVDVKVFHLRSLCREGGTILLQL